MARPKKRALKSIGDLKTFEYMAEVQPTPFTESTVDDLNDKGAIAWEICSVIVLNQANVQIIWKRAIVYS